MTCTRSGGTPSSTTSRSRPWWECTTTASARSYRRRWARSWPGRGSRGRTSCAVMTSGPVAGKQTHVDRLDGRPLEVHDVRLPRGAAVAQHVGNVLDQTGGGAPPRARRRGSEPVEALVHRVALRGRNVAVGEAAGHQRDVRARARERGRQGAIVRGRVGRWVDDVNAHGAA